MDLVKGLLVLVGFTDIDPDVQLWPNRTATFAKGLHRFAWQEKAGGRKEEAGRSR